VRGNSLLHAVSSLRTWMIADGGTCAQEKPANGSAAGRSRAKPPLHPTLLLFIASA
jgi:hypothetical protein